MSTHPAQLLICHEHIGARPASSVHEKQYQFCSLPSAVWCFDCEYYVCDIHAVARHERHRTQAEAEGPSE